MRFGYTIIYVDNVKETMAFYEKAFGVKQAFFAESGFYGEVETDSATKHGFVSAEFAVSGGIEFTQNSRVSMPAGIEIAFIADDVQLAYDKACEAGAEGIKTPETKPWGQIVAKVRDNNGVLVEICTEMK